VRESERKTERERAKPSVACRYCREYDFERSCGILLITNLLVIEGAVNKEPCKT